MQSVICLIITIGPESAFASPWTANNSNANYNNDDNYNYDNNYNDSNDDDYNNNNNNNNTTLGESLGNNVTRL